MLQNNWLALLVTFALAFSWLRINNYLAYRGWIDSQDSRKIIHIGTGPLFVLCWPLFTEAASSRYIAALVPLVITLQFILIGLGLWKDESAVQSMSRSGDRREILRGPLIYGIVFVILTILYWTNSPIGIIALMLMCGGDGLADILGRHYGKHKLPWSPRKTWMGSIGMLIGGWTLAIAVLAIYIGIGFFKGPLSNYLIPVTVIALAGTFVESLPYPDIDNLTVTLTAVFVGYLFF
jgi:phytol kinase